MVSLAANWDPAGRRDANDAICMEIELMTGDLYVMGARFMDTVFRLEIQEA